MPILYKESSLLRSSYIQASYSAITRKIACNKKKLKEPNNIDDLCHFPGSTGYYKKFIPLFADVTRPLNEFLKKDTKFQWSLKCQAAFKHLKQTLCKEPIHPYPSIEKPYILFPDTSHYAYSQVLTQVVKSPEDLRPVAFTPGSFWEMQQKWSPTEKQAYVVYHLSLSLTYTYEGQSM